MMTSDKTVRPSKACSLLLLLVPMGFVPLFVYASAPHGSTRLMTSFTSTATTTCSGRAFDAQVTETTGILPPVTKTIVDTGHLPPAGGVIDATLLTLTLRGGSADALMATTMGLDSKAQSEAAIA